MKYALQPIVCLLLHIAILFQIPLFAEIDNIETVSVHPNELRALVAITFHYVENRLVYLKEVLAGLESFPKVDVIVITNTVNKKELDTIRCLRDEKSECDKPEMSVSIRSFPKLDHPFNLTWCHKPIIRDEFLNNSLYTHFIYLEDDIKFDFKNFRYFIKYREKLKPFGLIPSFLRVEYRKSSNHFVNTDNIHPIEIATKPHLYLDEYVFVNLPNPYNACFVLDKELAEEYVLTRSFDPLLSTFCNWDVRERAAMGLCFENIPLGYACRYVVPVVKSTKIPPTSSWIFHLPNNYANSGSPFGKIPMDSLFFGSCAELGTAKKQEIKLNNERLRLVD